MLEVDEKDRVPGGNRKTYARSVSWSDRSPTKSSGKAPQWSSKARACLPPLQPLSITRATAEEWPCAGSDDLGVWGPNPPTPGVRLGSVSTREGSATKQASREFEFRKDKLAFFNKECSKIVDHIYLGSDTVAKNRDILRENGITHVLNCVGFSCPEYFKDDLAYKTLWLMDSPTEDITSILYDVFDYFEDVREQGGRVFVHCFQGVSRSTSLVIAYLMWKEGLSFEDAFQHVKAARGVTNPNMGFACQLLQCQKRVHALPVSPTSVLRMYRMAPHSPYDPLHLVPKMLNEPGARGLDSRGAFLILIPSAIYVWIGKHCVSVMSDNARAAAFQVIRYEKAQGPVLVINEGKEPSDFWCALSHENFFAGGCGKEKTKVEASFLAGNGSITDITSQSVGQKKVAEYDLDFEIFFKALAGGVVPPFPLSGTDSETCLPARENGWSRLRRKFSSGIMKEFITASKLYSHTGQKSPVLDKMDTTKELSSALPSSPSSPQSVSPDSFSSYATSSPSWTKDPCRDVENSGPDSEPVLSPSPSFSSLDSLSCFLVSKPKSNTTSPSLSPSNSDYSSSFTFSPSSSNWSDLAYLSAQPSPTRVEHEDPNFKKNDLFKESSSLLCKETYLPAEEAFPTSHALRRPNSWLQYKEASPSLAERRGSHPPPRMMLRSSDDSAQISVKLVRTSSFSLPNRADDTMKCVECDSLNDGDFVDTSNEELMLDAESSITDDQLQSGVQLEIASANFYDRPIDVPIRVAETTNLGLYQWPSMHKLDLASGIFDSRSAYIIVIPDLSLDKNNLNSLYIWIGRDVQWEESPNQVINNYSMSEDGHVHWEKVGRSFLLQQGLATSSLVQIVKEGEEPEQLLKHLRCFSFDKALDIGIK